MKNKPIPRLFSFNTGLFLAALFAFAYITIIYNLFVGLAELLVCVALAFFNVWQNSKKEKEITEYIENLAFHADFTSKDSLLRFPLPLTVIQMNGSIIWYNEHFQRLIGEKNLFEKNLSEFTKNKIDIPEFVENNSTTGVEIELNDKLYRVMINVIKTDNGEIFSVLYWLEETELVTLRKIYTESKPVVSIIMIDNYEDVLQSAGEDVKSQLIANIEKKLSEWSSTTNGIFKKIGRDKYLYIFEHRFLEGYIESKFDILDTIRELRVGENMPVTISIGIGMDGDSFTANDAFARSAIDMALGRGGDQVVIKTPVRFIYYGGKSKELEKRTRVRARVVAFAIKELINQAENVVIMGHSKPDLDSIGAALGLYTAAHQKGKTAHIVMEEVPKSTQKLVKRLSQSIKLDDVFLTRSQSREITAKNTLLIVVDVFRQTLVECPELLSKTDNIVVIDHHRKHAEFIENAVLTYHEPYASSTCEMVTELLQYIDDSLVLSPSMAEALYAGIALDTKNFTFKTGIRTFEAAAYLRRLGANITDIKQLFQFDMDFYTMRSDIVKSAMAYRDGIAIAKFSNYYEDLQLLCAQGADEMLNIEGITASFVICAVDNFVNISGRSIGSINVQVILEKLGGGGHITIAAAQLKSVTAEESETMLKKAIDEYLNENIR